MSNPTSAFGWQMPTSSDLVTDLPADFEVFGQAVDTSLADLKGGTTGQVLAKNSNTDMDFVWTAGGDITAVTAGTGITGGGTSGDVTITNSMATAIDAKGDLIAGTGADAFSRVAVGTNGQVLQADSGASAGVSWISLSTGSLTSLASGSLPTGAATLTLSSISQSYKKLYLVVIGFRTSTNGDYLRMRFNGVTTGTYGSQNSFASGGIVMTDTSMRVQNAANSTSNNGQINIELPNYTTTNTKYYTSLGMDNSATSGEGSMTTHNGGTHTTTAISSITLFSNSTNNFANGTYILYGVN